MNTPSTASQFTAGKQKKYLVFALLITVLAMICAGFLFTMIARSGFWLLLSFGLLGVIVFFQSFPWLAVAVFVLLDVGVAIVLRRSFAWRYQSLPLLIGALVALTLGGGFLFSRTSLYAWWQPPPPRHGSLSDPLLRGYGAWRFHNLFPGTVSEIRDNGYVILGPDGQTFVIDVTPGTEYPEGRDFAVGDGILVIGETKKESIRAFGIRPFTPPIPPPKKNKL
ncbi:MAG: hypothetical protein HOO67_04855 [Candidatus Peribacteraceae bacterium]|nr:hypothetical protein [Candidatus Peribacteraceae bacterium]